MDRLDDEAAAALYALAHLPVEHMGALYGPDLKRSNIVSSDDSGKVRGRLSVPRSELAALFHNHPSTGRKDANRPVFSMDDKDQARRLGVPSYISAGDRIRRFDPVTGQTSDVLAQFPIDEWRRQMIVEILGRAPDDPRGAMK